MKRKSIFRTLLTSLCCTMALSGQLAQAAGPAFLTASRVADVALTSTGELRGQVLNAEGVPQTQVKVAIGQTSQQPTFVSTDEDGRFAVRGLSAGIYQVQTSHGNGVYRVWAPNTAPPSAQPGVLVVSHGQIARGYGGHGGAHWLANPWVMGGIVAAAIAIPLAIDSGS
ncbi:MAG: carboxypeptidase-like regulatory domain-containing protein [Pirellulaceae bacterium]|nr:carboxypeptidase-like regulatory domain-containing protein [Pirellulaceae bacterium]HJN10827.1 carboxypeptidase-like regulatory domain-containing protein [Pirellulaceae bacterium]